MPTDTTRFDPVTLEVLWTRLISIVDEAAAALVRTSFSTIVRESNDFACVITDAQGHSIAGEQQHPFVHRHGAAHHPQLPRGVSARSPRRGRHPHHQ